MSSSQETTIDWNGEYFVCTSGANSYSYSSDGTNWANVQLGSSGFSTKRLSVAKWLGDKFVVAGNLVASSENGISQNCLLNVMGNYSTQITTNLETDTIFYDIEKSIELPNKIVFPRTTILALGNTSAFISVDQGNSWSTSLVADCRDAVWNGDQWVCVGGGGGSEYGTIMTSLDGRSWLNRGKYVFSTSCNGIDWSPQQNKYVAVGQGSYVVGSSSDGIYWKGENASLFSVGHDIKWNGEVWVAVGEGSNANTIAYSSDGVAWNYAAGGGFGIRGRRVHWNGDSWTAFGEDATYNIAKSVDGINWNLSYVSGATALSLGESLPQFADPSLNMYVDMPFQLRSPAATIRKYVHNHSDKGTIIIQPIAIACGEGSTTLAYSYDGIRWLSANNAVFSRCNKAAWNGEVWVAVGTGDYCIATSSDGITWQGVNSSAAELFDVAWNGSVWMAVGTARILRSPDGVNWTSVSENVFLTRIHAIEWTGEAWIAYGSGTNTTAVSFNGTTWTAQNWCINDCSDLSGSYTASSSQTSFSAENAKDRDSTTQWKSATANYDASGNYVGSQSEGGEWLQIQLDAAAVCKHYYLVLGNAAKFSLWGSSSAASWVLLDEFLCTAASPPNTKWVLPLALPTNTTSYSFYKIVFEKTFGSDYVAVSEFALFDSGTNTLDKYIRPIVLKDCVLHPTRVFSVDGSLNTIYRITDLSSNLIRDGRLAYCSSRGEPVAAAFNGEYHAVFSKTGEVDYLSNAASLKTFQFDNSLNGVSITSGLTDIRAACYNRRFILVGGAGGAAYGVLYNNSPPAFYPSNLTSLMSTVYGLASNSKYGRIVSNNTIHLKEYERLSITTPKTHNDTTSISFNVHKSLKIL